MPSTLDLEMRPIPCAQHGEQTHQQRIHPDLSVFESSDPQVGRTTRPRVKLRNNGRNGTERSTSQRSESSRCGARSNTSRASSTSRTSQSSRIAVQTAEFDTGDGWSSSALSSESASESNGAATTERMRRESAPAATQNAVQHPRYRPERPRRKNSGVSGHFCDDPNAADNSASFCLEKEGESQITIKKEHQLEAAGEVVCMLYDRGENAVMARANGVIYIYSDERRDFVSLFDRSTYTQLLTESAGPRHPNWRELSAAERTLPPLSSLLPGYAAKRHTRFGYGFSEEWRAFVEAQTPKPASSETVAAGGSTSTTAVSQSGPVIASQSGPLDASQSGPLGSVQSGPLGTSQSGPLGTSQSGPLGTSQSGPLSTSQSGPLGSVAVRTPRCSAVRTPSDSVDPSDHGAIRFRADGHLTGKAADAAATRSTIVRSTRGATAAKRTSSIA